MSSETSTLHAARAHARSQAGAAPVTVPATNAVDLPTGVAAGDVVWDETLPAGGYSARVLRRDTVVRLTDLEGDGSVALHVWVADRPTERVNVADTVKVQWQAYLGPGALLLSDMGRVLMTMVADTSARHDCLCGCSTRGHDERRYGDGSVSGPTPNARDLLVLAAAKHGLGRADLAPTVNLFKGAIVGDDGSLTFDGDPRPGAHVELRAELDVLVALANVPHPLDRRPAYEATPVRVTAWHAPRPDDDPFRASTPERLRAFLNTEAILGAEAR
jgi:urea carboxylase-associated protein 2